MPLPQELSIREQCTIDSLTAEAVSDRDIALKLKRCSSTIFDYINKAHHHQNAKRYGRPSSRLKNHNILITREATRTVKSEKTLKEHWIQPLLLPKINDVSI